MAAPVFGRRVDHARNVAGGPHHKAFLAGQHLGRRVGAANRHDMVFTRTVNVDRQIQLAQVDFFATHHGLAGLDQVVFQVGVAQIPGVKRTRQVGGVAVPVQQVERGRGLPLQVVVHHIVPHQVIGAQKTEGAGQVLPLHQAAAAHLLLAVLDEGFVNENIQNSGVGEIKQGREKGGAGHRLLSARGQHRQRRAQHGAADAETQGIDALGPGNFLRHTDRLDDRVFNVVVPCFLGQRGIRVAPAHHESAVPLRHGIADEGVFRLQVQDIKLVDARRHEQERPLKHPGGQRLVFDQLEQLVFEHHGTLGGGHVLAHLKQAFVGHGHMALTDVVNQVLHAFGNALAAGLDRLLLRLGVEGQEVARGRRRQPLLDGETDAGAGLGIGLYRIRHTHQGMGVELVGRRGEGRHRVGPPGLRGKALVVQGRCRMTAPRPKSDHLREVLLLQGL